MLLTLTLTRLNHDNTIKNTVKIIVLFNILTSLQFHLTQRRVSYHDILVIDQLHIASQPYSIMMNDQHFLFHFIQYECFTITFDRGKFMMSQINTVNVRFTHGNSQVQYGEPFLFVRDGVYASGIEREISDLIFGYCTSSQIELYYNTW